MNSMNLNPTLAELLSAACDGNLTEEQSKALVSMLDSDESALDDYLEFFQIHAELRQSGRARHCVQSALNVVLRGQQGQESSAISSQASAVVIEVKPASLSRRKKRYDSIHWQRHKVRFNAMTAVLTALAWVGFSYFVWYSTTPDNSRPNHTGSIQYVAEITGQYEHRWAEGMPPMFVRHALLSGERLNLAEGLVEITFDGGAVVVLEGPTDFVIDSPGAGTLEVGKLAARVPERAIGFVVTAAGHEIVDLGTEFGVQVDPTDGVKVFVYQGSVYAHATDPTTSESRRYTIEAGEAMHLVTDEGLSFRSIPVDELRLVRRFPRPFSRSPLSDQDRVEVVAYRYGEGDLPSLEPDHSDDDFKKLTDHQIGTDRWEDGHWVGVVDGLVQRTANYTDSGRPQPRIDFELNETATLDLVVIHYLVNHEVGIHAPDRVVLSLSSDGEQFNEILDIQGFDNTPDPPEQLRGSVREYRINLGHVALTDGRFVRVDVYNDEQWTFLGEVAFYRSDIEHVGSAAQRDR